MLDIVRLRVLAAIAEHGSVTAAARRLHYSQPSVSHHLARLEAETGTPLVRRAGRGIRLTPAGELLARRAAEIVGRVEAASAELAALAELRTGRVRLVGFQSVLSTVVPRAAVLLRDAHPGIELEFGDAHPRVAVEMLREGRIDAAVIFGYDDEVPAGVRVTHLFDDPMYVLSLDGGTLLDHRDSDWIAGCANCRAEFLDACASAGFTPRIVCTSDDTLVTQALVAAGSGVTTTPGLVLRAHRAAGVKAVEVPGFRRRIYFAVYGDPPDPPATAAFAAALREAVRPAVPQEPGGDMPGP